MCFQVINHCHHIIVKFKFSTNNACFGINRVRCDVLFHSYFGNVCGRGFLLVEQQFAILRALMMTARISCQRTFYSVYLQEGESSSRVSQSLPSSQMSGKKNCGKNFGCGDRGQNFQRERQRPSPTWSNGVGPILRTCGPRRVSGNSIYNV